MTPTGGPGKSAIPPPAPGSVMLIGPPDPGQLQQDDMRLDIIGIPWSSPPSAGAPHAHSAVTPPPPAMALSFASTPPFVASLAPRSAAAPSSPNSPRPRCSLCSPNGPTNRGRRSDRFCVCRLRRSQGPAWRASGVDPTPCFAASAPRPFLLMRRPGVGRRSLSGKTSAASM